MTTPVIVIVTLLVVLGIALGIDGWNMRRRYRQSPGPPPPIEEASRPHGSVHVLRKNGDGPR